MSNQLTPIFIFNGQAREALNFYREVFGGELRIISYGDMNVERPGFTPEHVMHGHLTTADGWSIMADDSTEPSAEVVRGGCNYCVWGDDLEQAQRQFDLLSEGGKVGTTMKKQMWGDVYGDLVDRFGINWSFNIGPDAS